MTARRRIDEIGDESRRRILDAAEELFAERGPARTTFVDIAERSGISRGSIPWHFANKDGLVVAVVERAIERAMPPGRYTGSTPLTEVFADTAELARRGDSALMLVMLAEAIGGREDVRARYQDFVTRRVEGLERWLQTQRPAGVDPEAAAVRERNVAVALNGALLGIHLQSLVGPADVDLDAALAAIAGLVETHLTEVWTAPPTASPQRSSDVGRSPAPEGGDGGDVPS
ncbi:TetR/AcrR family transcriptional regulator [Pseudonocardia sp. DR1-2]|uniref:TetR/AcrR family transcriptional regulator n=1 Tax=Pseudonocardia sp. DR1-2 TaxID=2951168 RepID=UPI0020431F77|nr:TetR/AcrR family transcriptional regulator [Pseudonocardia sp. DR1-2]MCM3849672.1 TetR/AcrR family transcriptional regulator [Pseudonocardia sp. DR1-2]